MAQSPSNYFFRSGGGGSSATGTTGKNYLSQYNGNPGNGDFELGTTANWSLGTIGTLTNGLPTGSPTFGSGASGNLSISATNTNPLGAKWSMSYASSAATTAGNMVASAAFTIDIEDQAKVLGVKFYYNPTSNPTNGNWSGTSSNSFAWAAYDVTNSVWLSSAGNFNIVQSTGVGICIGTIQAGATTMQIRLCIYNANATSGAITVLFDDFFVGPQTAPMGPAMTDWTSFTPTGSWVSNTTYTGWWKREGDQLSMIIKLALAGAPTSANLTVNIPSGLSIDTTKLPGTPGNTIFGNGYGQGAAHGFVPAIAYSSTTALALSYYGDGSTAADLSVVAPITQAAPYTFANGDFIYFQVTGIPIVGWSSNTVSSADTDTRVIAAAYSGTSTTVNNTTVTVIPTTVSFDTSGSTSSGTFTIPVSGYYQLAAEITSASVAWTAGQALVVYYSKNGGAAVQLGLYRVTASQTSQASVNGAGLVQCNAGDTIVFKCYSDVSNTPTQYAASINRLSGPAVVQAVESVSAKYTQGAAVGFTNTIADIVVPFTTKVWDTHNFFGGTQAVIPVSGKYRISAILNLQSATFSVGNSFYSSIYQNGAALTYGPVTFFQATGSFNTMGSMISTDISANAGDTIEVRFAHNRTGGGATLTAASANNNISIERIGN